MNCDDIVCVKVEEHLPGLCAVFEGGEKGRGGDDGTVACGFWEGDGSGL